MKKVGAFLIHVLLLPAYLLVAIWVAAFSFMAWAGQDANKRGSSTVLLALTLPAIIGWVIIGLDAGEVYELRGWLRIVISLLFGLVALYAFFSLDRLEPALDEILPQLDPKRRKWIVYGFLALNLPVITAIFGSLSARYE